MTQAHEFNGLGAVGSADLSVVDVTILATTDLHAHLFPFNYFTDRRDDTVGLVRVASEISNLCAIKENCFLLDNGDTLQGAPLGDVAAGLNGAQDRPHPMIAAMNAIGYDAATLGNHDFDFGLSVAERAAVDATFPVVLANARRANGSAFLPGNVVLRRTVTDRVGRMHDLRLGVVGVAPPQIARWHKAILQDALVWEDMVGAVAREVAALAGQADLVVVLAHSGVGGERPGDRAENAAGAIAALDGVDAVIAGHTHRAVADLGVNGSAPIVQPGHWGSHLGEIVLTMSRPVRDDSAEWAVSAGTANLHAATQDRPRSTLALRRSLRRLPALRAQLLNDHRVTRRQAGEVIGRTAHRLTSYFAMVGRSAAMDVVAHVKQQEAACRLSDEAGLRDLPILAAVAPFKAGGRGGPQHFTDVPTGPLRLRNAADLYVFPNFLSVLKVTGADIRDWLETSAAVFRQIDPTAAGDDPQRLLEEDFASYYFDVLYGLTYRIDVSAAAASGARVRDVTLADGRPLADTDEVLVATNNFRATGGGGFAAAARSDIVLDTSDAVRDCVAAYLKSKRGPINHTPQTVWQFAPLGGVQVCFRTGPGAASDAPARAALGLTDLGQTENGFQRFGLSL